MLKIFSKRQYSGLALARNAFSRHRNWQRAWRDPEPKSSYDVVIIGAGGHGLATAYYLAELHGIRNVAVLEKGWLGGGNTGRNTTIVRSNYHLDGNAKFYEHSLKLWEGLSQQLNYNVMFSQRGVLNLAHSDSEMEKFSIRGNAMRFNGIDAELLMPDQVRRSVPHLDCSQNTRYPIFGGLLQKRGGTARHDAVAWGYARAADALGIDIIQNCEVTGIKTSGNRVTAVETSRGTILCGQVGLAVAGNSGRLAAMAGLRLPIESHVLQAIVTEPLKPIIHTVVTSSASHVYVNQTDKGEVLFGGDLDLYNSYAQRGNLPRIEYVVQSVLTLFPCLSRVRMMRTWGGVMDMSMDGSPIIGKTPVDGLYLNSGWCYGGFKATPGSGWCFAHTIAHDQPHTLNEPFSLERFSTGALLDENGSGAFPNSH
ncbi:MAG: sarcosine oxidase subunit beta family protein [Acidiferrobacterales bacterium]|nr:sarcosine oxidase subunit beta family protein [Acidiferrobacterales bacterium]